MVSFVHDPRGDPASTGLALRSRSVTPRSSRVFSRAFTMVELLVVTAVVTLLASMLMPGLSSAREQVRRVVCKSNLRQWGNAFHYYREDYGDRLPTEGTFLGSGFKKSETWFNALPPYLDLPPYWQFEGVGESIKELPNMHVWICPSKNLTDAYKSGSGKNQFHYGMNQVLDGLGKQPDGSKDAPGFPDEGSEPLRASRFDRHPRTVLLFDIAGNSPAGTPRSVATVYQRTYRGGFVGKFHGDYANVFYLSGGVGNCSTDDLVEDHDFQRGAVVWTHPKLYWGYPPPRDYLPEPLD